MQYWRYSYDVTMIVLHRKCAIHILLRIVYFWPGRTILPSVRFLATIKKTGSDSFRFLQ